jgi:TRAP-type uncharacterized transport system substrate-binding protein
MQKISVILGCALFFGTFANSKASSLDSPDIVYIDGQPCNSACQSYMAWSRQVMPVPGQSPQVQAKAAAAHQHSRRARARSTTRIREAGVKPAAYRRSGDRAAPTSAQERQAATTDLQPAGKAAATSDTADAKVVGSAPTVVVATHVTNTASEQVQAAVAVAERLTATTTVAIVMARPEIKSVSDLAGKSVAISNGQYVHRDSIRTAIVKAGAAEVQLTEAQVEAFDQLIGGEVPAAVLTLASPEAAEAFPEIAGFKVFRIALTPEVSRATNAESQPATSAAAASKDTGAKIANQDPTAAVTTAPRTKTTPELVKAATAVAERMTAATATADGIESKTDIAESSDRLVTARSSNADPQIAILLVLPEIKSVSDLAGKEIAIDDRLSEATEQVRAAIAAAGAAEVRLEGSQTGAIDRLMGGAASAAVLTLASPEASEGFPEVAGFRIFRIPLSSH